MRARRKLDIGGSRGKMLSLICAMTLFSTPNAGVESTVGVAVHWPTAYPVPPVGGAELTLLKESGIKWVRTDLYWSAIEKVAGQMDFSSYLTMIRALPTVNVSALFILDYGNPIYTGGQQTPTADRRADRRVLQVCVGGL